MCRLINFRSLRYYACKDDLFSLPVGGSYVEWNSGSNSCQKMSNIYSQPKDMCEKMFNGAYIYSTPTPNGNSTYTISPGGHKQGLPNVNDFVQYTGSFTPVCSPNQGAMCLVQNDLSLPISTIGTQAFQLCTAWQDNACCSVEMTSSIDKLFDNPYFNGLHSSLDVCGGLSESCLSWFTSFACLYSCDVNIGKYAKSENVCATGEGLWEVMDVPVKADDCDKYVPSL